MNNDWVQSPQESEELQKLLNVVREKNSMLASEETCWVYAAFTDTLLIDRWESEPELETWIREREDKLLELRVFSRTAEYRLSRGNLGKCLRFREKSNDAFLNEKTDYYDEEQYLDIDTTHGKEIDGEHSRVRTTGGGIYMLPLSKVKWKDARLRVRNYLSYYESGQAYVSDWRLVELIAGGEANGK